MKTTTKLTVCGLVLSTAVACAPAYDNRPYHMDHAKMESSYFNTMDTNKNGIITLGEMRLFAEKEFYETDVNGDKVVTRDEFHLAKQRKMEMHKSEYGNYDRSGNAYTQNRADYNNNRDMRSNYYYNNQPSRYDNNAAYRMQNQADYNNNRAGIDRTDSTAGNDNYYYNDDRNRWDRRYR